MSDAENIAAAEKWLSKRSKKALRDDTAWDVIRNFLLRHKDGERLLNAEKLRRGLITLSDLTPVQRRALIDPEAVDLHALAAGPIMDSNEIFLPAGKLSMEETRAREAAAILAAAPSARHRARGTQTAASRRYR